MMKQFVGIVEGLTEFAPVSSTGHMILVRHLLGVEGTVQATTFDVQLGSILAVVFVFWKQILILVELYEFEETCHPEEVEEERKRKLNWLPILLGMLPAVMLGGLFHDYI